MIRLERSQQFPVQTGNIARIDQRRLNPAFPQPFNNPLAEGKEAAQPQNGNFFAPFHRLIAVQAAVIFFNLADGRTNLGRNADHHRMRGLFHRPVKHGQIFLFAGRRQINDIRNIADQRNVKTAEVSDIAAGNAGAGNQNHRRIVVDCQILRKLVVSSLYERTPDQIDRFAAAFGQGRGHCHRMFFGNADVNEVFAQRRPFFRIDAESARRAGINRDHRFVFGNFVLQIIVSDVIVAFAAGFNRNFAGFDVKRQIPVPSLLVFLGKFITFAF